MKIWLFVVLGAVLFAPVFGQEVESEPSAESTPTAESTTTEPETSAEQPTAATEEDPKGTVKEPEKVFVWSDERPTNTELKLSRMKTRSSNFHFEDESGNKFGAPAYARFFVTSYDPVKKIYSLYFTGINDGKASDDSKKQRRSASKKKQQAYNSFNQALSELQPSRVAAKAAVKDSTEEVQLYTYYTIKEEHFTYGIHFDKLNSIVHGTLAVPFKYRNNTQQVTGDGTIGYYAGISFHNRRWSYAPILAGGVSNVKVVTDGAEKDEFGITVTTGMLVTFRDKFQIGVVAGVDRISDSTWEHNGKLWTSFMIGYQFGQ